MFLLKIIIVLIAIVITFSMSAKKTLNIAVASNFAHTMDRVSSAYTDKTGEKVNVLLGSTGRHALQVTYGAPIDLFFSADQKRPQHLFEKGKSGKPFTYAIGKLAYWMPSYSGACIDFECVMKLPEKRIVIANPKHAPYGRASQKTLQKLSLWEKGTDESRFVFSENINQSYAMIQSKALVAGFVAYAQIKQSNISDGQFWLVPHHYYPSIKQDAVIIHPSQQVTDFLSFFKTQQVQALIEVDGYQLP